MVACNKTIKNQSPKEYGQIETFIPKKNCQEWEKEKIAMKIEKSHNKSLKSLANDFYLFFLIYI